jgi:hypothetical protein
MTSTKFRPNCSSMRKSSDKVVASWSSENAICHWRICRSEDENRSLDILTRRNKSIWSNTLLFWQLEKDMKPIKKLKNGHLDIWTSGHLDIWTDWMNIRSPSYVIWYYHWHSYWITIEDI